MNADDLILIVIATPVIAAVVASWLVWGEIPWSVRIDIKKYLGK
jgi:hypothetical protein